MDFCHQLTLPHVEISVFQVVSSASTRRRCMKCSTSKAFCQTVDFSQLLMAAFQATTLGSRVEARVVSKLIAKGQVAKPSHAATTAPQL